MCEKEQRISLVGIGMGTEDGVTVHVQQIIRSCDCLIGAQRMLDCAQRICAQAVKNADTGKVREMQKTPGQKAVLVEYCRIELAPGISSVAYLAARLGTSWEDAALVSLHGKDEDFIQTVDRNRKTILLLGGGQSGEKVLGRLKEYGMDHVTVHAGSRLSYEDERIVSGKPSELSEKDLAPGERREPACERRGVHPGQGTHDEGRGAGSQHCPPAAYRGCSSMGRGRRHRFDIRGGCALRGQDPCLCGGEKSGGAGTDPREPEEVPGGRDPGVLETLEAPTHVFIGGSSGNLQEILSCVLEKNENARIVVNAISLETVKEVMEAAESGTLKSPEITQLTVSRSRELGRYHMMTGQNPVYIVSAGGTADERGEA